MPEHGTRSTYVNHHCRCHHCRQANTNAQRNYRHTQTTKGKQR